MAIMINEQIQILPPIIYGFKIIRNRYGRFKRFDDEYPNSELVNCQLHPSEYSDICSDATKLKNNIPYKLYIPTLILSVLTIIISLALKILKSPLEIKISTITPLLIIDIFLYLIISFRLINRYFKLKSFFIKLNEKFKNRNIKFYYKIYYTSKTICMEYPDLGINNSNNNNNNDQHQQQHDSNFLHFNLSENSKLLQPY